MYIHLLEDGDYCGFFITQQLSQNLAIIGDNKCSENEEMMEVVMHVDEHRVDKPMYSDISDPENNFVNPPYGRVNE